MPRIRSGLHRVFTAARVIRLDDIIEIQRQLLSDIAQTLTHWHIDSRNVSTPLIAPETLPVLKLHPTQRSRSLRRVCTSISIDKSNFSFGRRGQLEDNHLSDPLHRGSLQRSPDPVAGGDGACLPKNPIAALVPSDLQLRPFGSCHLTPVFFQHSPA